MARKPRKQARDWETIDREILDALDLRAEFEALGVEIVGREPNSNGWLACRAVGRDDKNPSAGVNLEHGRYRDLGGEDLSLSLWDLAVHLRRQADWKTAREHYAAKAGVKIPDNRKMRNPAESLKFMKWNPTLVQLWCRQKAGITLEAVQAAGGRLCRHFGQHTCVGLPIFGTAGNLADPVGWVLWQTNGQPLPIFHGNGRPPTAAKMKTTSGSRSGLMGLHAIEQAPRSPEAAVWKVEGPTDLLALWASQTPEEREKHLVTCNAGGGSESPKPEMLGLFSGRRVVIVHDADKTGETGAEKWVRWLGGIATEVRHVRLPYKVEEKHGKDLRDWLSEGHTFAQLAQMAEAAAPLKPAEEPTPVVVEADDDPHRLARLFLKQHPRHPIRFWREEYWQYTGTHYHRRSVSELKGRLTACIKQEFDRLYLEQIAAGTATTDDEETPPVRKVSRQLVGNALGSLDSLTLLPGDTKPPAWLDDRAADRPHCIALQNGILDLDALLANRTDHMIEHSPEWFSPVCLPYAFNPKADAPTWKRVILENLEGDGERIALLQEWAGYLLLGDTSQQHFMVLEGEGANGKSVYCAALEAMLGEDNVSHVPLEMFSHRFALASSLDKLANIATECGELDKTAEGTLKQFTAGDRMQFDRKNLPPVEAAPTARFVLATNNRPRFSDRSGGLWRRMLLVPFTYEVPQDKRILGMDKAAWWTESGELSGVLNWAIAGLYRLRRQKGFTQSAKCNEALEDYRVETNPARNFLHDLCVADREAMISSKQLYEAYSKWCKSYGYRPLGERQFGKEVFRAFPKTKRRRMGSGARFWAYDGILLKDEESGF